MNRDEQATDKHRQTQFKDSRVVHFFTNASYAAVIILYGLVAFGQIQLRKIDGHQQLPSFMAKEWQRVA